MQYCPDAQWYSLGLEIFMEKSAAASTSKPPQPPSGSLSTVNGGRPAQDWGGGVEERSDKTSVSNLCSLFGKKNS